MIKDIQIINSKMYQIGKKIENESRNSVIE